MRKSYASDISKENFEEIRLLLQNVRRITKPATVDLYEVFCAILYLLRTGYQWRFFPSEFPKWRTVHSYFARWSESDHDGISILEQALKNQVSAARLKLGKPSTLICAPALGFIPTIFI